ncbi:uncharacterized protein LOC134812275 isoform X1 [Bolinopsis microptera]|uniref:uncharacterized protein LOC134812275 isoform X1 n=1 Tax=Bolinopsis microptera TaxID=2820187 RepID=UPI0030790E87
MLVLVLQLLVTTVKSDMVCDSDGVKCVKDPANCDSSAPTDCNYLLKYKAASADTTKIEISGKPSKFSLTSYLENMWLVFGFSPSSSGMSGINLYACQLVGGTQYDVRKLKTNGYSGVDNAGSAIVAKGGSVSGSNQDDLMSCSYEILNSELPTSNQYLVKAMGPMAGENSMSKHRMTPKRGTLMKLQQEFIPPVECPVGEKEVNNVCQKCPAGDYQDLTGQTSCKTCDSGHISAEGSSKCTACSVGEKEVNNDCQKCPAGDYQDLTGQTSCKTCEENQFSAEAGQTQCEKCPDNTFSEEKADQCVDCPTETETSIRDSMENRNFGELLIQKCIDDNEESNEGEGEKKTDMIVETVTIEVHLEILRPGYLYYHSFQFG